MIKANSIYDNVITKTMAVLFFLMPVVFHPFISDPFSLPKATILRIAVIVLLALLALKAVSKGKIEWKQSPLNAPIMLFFAVTALSTLFSVYPKLSFWGMHGFYFEGLLSLSAYGLIYFISANYLTDVRIILKAIVYSSAIVSLYALVEALGISFFVWKGVSSYPRVWSTLGNPNFLGSFLIMSIPLCMVFMFESKVFTGRIIFFFICLLNSLALVFTYSRAAWLGLFVGAVIFILLVNKKVLKKNIAYMILLGCVGLLAVTFWPRNRELSRNNDNSLKPVISRVLSFGDLKDDDIASRISGWKTAIKMVSQRPVLGFGPDTFGVSFRRFMSADFEKLAGRLKTSGYAHNVFLEYGATMGLIGLAGYLFLLIVFLKTIVGVSRETNDNILATGIVSASLALIVNNLFSFSSLVPETIFWLFMGICSNMTKKSIKEKEIHIPVNIHKTAPYMILAVAGILLILSWRFLLASRFDRLAQDTETAGNLKEAIILQKKSVSMNPSQDIYRMRLAKLYQNGILPEGRTEDREEMFNKSVTEYKKQISVFKYDSLAYNGLGVALTYGAHFLNKKTLPEAVDCFKKAIEYDPYFAEAYSNLGAVYYETGKRNKAVQLYKEIIELKPEVAVNYYNLGLIYYFEKNYDGAVDCFKKALRINPHFEECKEALVEMWQNMEGEYK